MSISALFEELAQVFNEPPGYNTPEHGHIVVAYAFDLHMDPFCLTVGIAVKRILDGVLKKKTITFTTPSILALTLLLETYELLFYVDSLPWQANGCGSNLD